MAVYRVGGCCNSRRISAAHTSGQKDKARISGTISPNEPGSDVTRRYLLPPNRYRFCLQKLDSCRSDTTGDHRHRMRRCNDVWPWAHRLPTLEWLAGWPHWHRPTMKPCSGGSPDGVRSDASSCHPYRVARPACAPLQDSRAISVRECICIHNAYSDIFESQIGYCRLCFDVLLLTSRTSLQTPPRIEVRGRLAPNLTCTPIDH